MILGQIRNERSARARFQDTLQFEMKGNLANDRPLEAVHLNKSFGSV